MAAQLTADRTRLLIRALAAALVVVAAVAVLAGWHALTAGPGVLHGSVALVNADGSKFCVDPEDGGDQWCGALSTSGSEPPSVGQKVTVLVNTVEAEPQGSLTIGTVIPARFTVR